MHFNKINFETDCETICDCINPKKFQNTEVYRILREIVLQVYFLERLLETICKYESQWNSHMLTRASKSYVCPQIFYVSPSDIDSLIFQDLI